MLQVHFIGFQEISFQDPLCYSHIASTDNNNKQESTYRRRFVLTYINTYMQSFSVKIFNCFEVAALSSHTPRQ